jgi:hypothetical protein
MKRPIESDYTSLVAYTRALEEYCDTLAQPEQEPVGTVGSLFDENVILRRRLDRDLLVYTTPPTAQPEQEPVASNCTHEWIDDTKAKPAWRCIKCGSNYTKEKA